MRPSGKGYNAYSIANVLKGLSIMNPRAAGPTFSHPPSGNQTLHHAEGVGKLQAELRFFWSDS